MSPDNKVNGRRSSLEPGSEALPYFDQRGVWRGSLKLSSAGTGELARSLELDRRLAAAKGKAGEAREWIEGAPHIICVANLGFTACCASAVRRAA